MYFILFLGYVTVGLTVLQFISPSGTLLNHYPHLFYVQFLLTTSPAHTPYSFTHWFYQWRGTHVFGNPFPNTRQATKVARETTKKERCVSTVGVQPLVTSQLFACYGCSYFHLLHLIFYFELIFLLIFSTQATYSKIF